MDTPGYDPVSATGQVAGGANMICFTTGRGSAYGCAPSPSLKLATNSALWQRQEEDMDINCGEIVDGKASIQEMGQRIFELVLATASGEQTQEREARLRAERVRALAGRRGDVSAMATRPSQRSDPAHPAAPASCRPPAAPPTEAAPGGRQPGAGQPQRPRFARRGHAAALCRCGAGRRPHAQRQRRRSMLDIGTMLALDGQRGYGQVVGEQAMDWASRAPSSTAAAS